jgi:hypothetical protein
MIRIPINPPFTASKRVMVLVIAPLLGWLPLLGPDQFPTRRQQPAEKNRPLLAVRHLSADRNRSSLPTPATPWPEPRQPGQRRYANPADRQGGMAPKPASTIQAHNHQAKSLTPARRNKPIRQPVAQRQPPAKASNARSRQPPSRHGMPLTTTLPRSLQLPARPLPPAILSTIQPKAPRGAMLLGNLDLSSLEEKTMLPAARLERARQIASPDPLSVVPKALKPAFVASIPKQTRVIPAEIVRLPAPHLQAPEQIPLLLHPGGRARGPSAYSSEATRQRIAGWLARQPVIANGTVRPVVLKLEPLAASKAHPVPRPSGPAHRAKAARGPRQAVRRRPPATAAAQPLTPTPTASNTNDTNDTNTNTFINTSASGSEVPPSSPRGLTPGVDRQPRLTP